MINFSLLLISFVIPWINLLITHMYTVQWLGTIATHHIVSHLHKATGDMQCTCSIPVNKIYRTLKIKYLIHHKFHMGYAYLFSKSFLKFKTNFFLLLRFDIAMQMKLSEQISHILHIMCI